MDSNEFIHQQCIGLQREIDSRQSRQFWIVVMGLLGLPGLSCFLLAAGHRGWLILPFVVVVLVTLFLSQQVQIQRAGRCIREAAEAVAGSSPGWTRCVASGAAARTMDRLFAGCFVVVFFAYYFLSVAVALYQLRVEAFDDPSGVRWSFFFGAAGVYSVTTLWSLAALYRYGRLSASTAVDAKRGVASVRAITPSRPYSSTREDGIGAGASSLSFASGVL